MRPASAATMPCATTPRPRRSGAIVARRALVKTRSACMKITLGRFRVVVYTIGAKRGACTVESRMFFRHALLPGGWARDVGLSVKDGVISALEAGAAPAGEEHAIALPGMANLHSHSFQRAMAGLTESRGALGDSFWTWRDLMYRFALRMTPDDVEAVATQAFVEMLESGF